MTRLDPQNARNLLLRAGAFGTWAGGSGTGPEVGLTVPVTSAPEVRAVLAILTEHNVQVTLLVPPRLIMEAGPELREAARAGHQLAGQGAASALLQLEVEAGQLVSAWDPAGLSWPDLRQLAAWGVSPLPAPLERPEPGHTLRLNPQQLAAQLGRLRALGYRPVPVQSLPGLRRASRRDLLGLAYQRLVEDRFTRASRVIDLTARADAVMRVAPLDHAPPPLPLLPGTPTAELHLHSPRIVGLAGRGALGAYRAYQRSLRDVAQALVERPELHPAQAVFAVTLFHGPLAQSGFDLLTLPPLRARWYGLGFRVIRLMHGTARAPSEAEPKMAWMTREAFLERHGQAVTR
ncbi:YkoP family protein [Deinococcus navajonensis]|uniref:Sectered polysaccharide deacetylase n=1 Tax=Deinococcus navajonensis TaxID=309884 RepID=A0ABV8XQ39_9DEIO